MARLARLALFVLFAAPSTLSFVQHRGCLLGRRSTRCIACPRRALRMKEQLEQVRYGVDVPYKEAAYDPSAADAFFRARPLPALRRLGPGQLSHSCNPAQRQVETRTVRPLTQ